MASKISVEEEQLILQGIQREADNLNKILLTAQKSTSDRISQLHRQYPMLPGGVVLGLAKNNTPDAVIQQIAKETALAANENPEKMNGKPDGNWLSDAFKQVTRVGFSAANSTNELIQNVASLPRTFVEKTFNLASDVAQESSYDVGPAKLKTTSSPNISIGGGGEGSFLGSTTLATLIDNWDKQGTGYFVGSEITGEQAKRARAFRGVTDGGHAHTIGRGLAGVAFKEDSKAYNFLSGAIDGYVAVRVPVVPGLKAAGFKISELAEAPGASATVAKLGAVADTLQGRGVKIKISDLTGDELRDAYRLAGISGGIVDPAEANKFLGTRGGRRLVQRLLEADTADDIRNIVGKKVYIDTVKALRDAKTELDMQAVLADVLGLPGKGLTSTVGVKGVKPIMLSNARRTDLLRLADNLPGGKKIARGLAGRAGAIDDISSESPSDVRRVINDIDNWSKNVLMPEESYDVIKTLDNGDQVVRTLPGRRELLDKAVNALVGDSATPTARREFKELWEEVVPASLSATGVNDNVIKAVFQSFYEKFPRNSEYAKGVDGTPDDMGFYNGAVVGGEKVTDAAFGGPMLQSELANVIITMPDPKQVAALTNSLNFLWRKGSGELFGLGDPNLERLARAGELRLPAAAVSNFQDKIWRPLILFTGGYVVRNLQEAQMRLALTNENISGAFRHPLDWLGWVTHKKGGYDVLGQSWEKGLDETTESLADYRSAMQMERYGEFGDPSVVIRRGVRTGDFSVLDRTVVAPDAQARKAAGMALSDTEKTQRELIVLAHGDEIGFLNADPISRMFAQLGDSPASQDAVIDFIRNTEEGRIWFKEAQDYHINGRPVYNMDTGRYIEPQSVDLRNEQNLRLYLREIANRVELQTGGDARLLTVVAEGKLPPTRLASASNMGIGVDDVGREVRIGAGRKSSRVDRARVVSYDPVTDEAVVQYFAFSGGENTAQLRKLLELDDVFDNPNFPRFIRRESRVETKLKKNQLQQWDEGVNRAFGFLYGKPSRYLDRSPLYRQFYYTMAIDELLTSLDNASALRLYDNIVLAAQKTGTTPEKFLGDAKRWKKISDVKDGETVLKGRLTLEEVDAFAKGHALDKIKTVLYDTSTSSNYLDSARIVFPFARAWAEFYKSVGRMYTIPTASGMRLPNMGAIRKTQLVVEGGREADPDGDGRGFFYMDPETQEWSLTYPGSGLVGKALSGLNVGLSGPVSGALQGIDLGQSSIFGFRLQPGLGPWASMAASVILPDGGIFDDISKFFLPYGKTELSTEKGGTTGAIGKTLLPAWAKKIEDTFNEPESLNAYGNAVFETLQILLQSGKYDINDPKQMADAWEESRSKGKTLTWMRALGQWLGPSRPNLEFKTKSLQGDVFVNQAAADLRMLQQEDYDTAAIKFFDLYGETFFPYLARKTTTVGFEALGVSPEFGEWERENKSFLEQHPSVAGYFAPTSNTFDWLVYTRQLSTGQRRRQSNKEAFDEAQYFSANAQYRYKQKQLEQEYKTKDLPAEGKNILKQVKADLEKQYPGYKAKKFVLEDFESTIIQLTNAAFNKKMDDNRVAEATRVYLELRNKRVAIAASRGKAGLGAKSNSKLAGEMRQIAENIIVDYPEFEVLYERVLSKEID